MGTMYIIESSEREVSHRGSLAYPLHKISGEGFTDATLSTSGTSASHTLADKTRFVSIRPDVDVHIRVGTGTVTATTDDFLVPAYELFSFEIDGDTSRKLAAIEAS